jgi:predicted nucleotidyltransferase
MSLPPGVQSVLAHFGTAIANRFGSRLRECVLFGSYARGDAHEDSDIDVLVVVDGLTERERVEVMDLAYDASSAEKSAWIGLSPLPYATAQVEELRSRERGLLVEIARQGIPV